MVATNGFPVKVFDSNKGSDAKPVFKSLNQFANHYLTENSYFNKLLIAVNNRFYFVSQEGHLVVVTVPDFTETVIEYEKTVRDFLMINNKPVALLQNGVVKNSNCSLTLTISEKCKQLAKSKVYSPRWDLIIRVKDRLICVAEILSGQSSYFSVISKNLKKEHFAAVVDRKHNLRNIHPKRISGGRWLLAAETYYGLS